MVLSLGRVISYCVDSWPVPEDWVESIEANSAAQENSSISQWASLVPLVGALVSSYQQEKLDRQILIQGNPQIIARLVDRKNEYKKIDAVRTLFSLTTTIVAFANKLLNQAQTVLWLGFLLGSFARSVSQMAYNKKISDHLTTSTEVENLGFYKLEIR